MSTKLECAACIYAALRKTARWRENVATRFPDDPRNPAAANLLRKLSDTADLSDSQWDRIAPHFSRTSDKWCDALTEAGRLVGIRPNIRDFDGYFAKLTELLQVAQ